MTTLRKRKTRAARTALGAFMLVWLSMMLQPCLMAQDMTPEHDCPHCPAQNLEEPCHVSEAPCTFIDSYDYDGRAPQKLFDDNQPDYQALLSTTPRVLRPSTPMPTSLRGNGNPPVEHRPPLNIINCVFII